MAMQVWGMTQRYRKIKDSTPRQGSKTVRYALELTLYPNLRVVRIDLIRVRDR